MKSKTDIYGLVLTGGFSKRMGKDKSLLNFNGKAQFVYLFELLKPFCEEVFLSCRKDQSLQFGDQYPMIFDIHDGIGPMNGLLSFFNKYPHKACLIVACDMPFIDEKVIRFLIENRQPKKIATAFKSKKSFPEPLLTIWEPKSYEILKIVFQKGEYSLRDILQDNDCQILQTFDDKILLNINKPQELETVLKVLNLPPEKS
jgi:molybdenum cofactor guanylyltransferase